MFYNLGTALKTVKDGEVVIFCVVDEDIKVSQERLLNDASANTIGVVMLNVKNVPKHYI